jgi:hypothetical protein
MWIKTRNDPIVGINNIKSLGGTMIYIFIPKNKYIIERKYKDK